MSDKAAQIPQPAHPGKRREPLPWCLPKSAQDDPDAARRLQAILDAPNYRVANEDIDFLDSAEARGIRLQMDFTKAELLLREQDVARTIVVFGSSRIGEPAEALRNVEALERALQVDPHDRTIAQSLNVARRKLERSRYYETAREFGRLVGTANAEGAGGQTLIVTGGGPGLMEAANRGAFDAGAKNAGFNIRLPHEQYPNPYVTPELCFRFHYFALRKMHFVQRARALVAFPGGYGTFDELFEVLTLVQTRTLAPIPIVLVGRSFWDRAVDFDYLVAEGVIDAEDRDLFWFAETATEIWDGIRTWERRQAEYATT